VKFLSSVCRAYTQPLWLRNGTDLMPARDSYHETVVRALQEDGWTITADPFWLALPMATVTSTSISPPKKQPWQRKSLDGRLRLRSKASLVHPLCESWNWRSASSFCIAACWQLLTPRGDSTWLCQTISMPPSLPLSSGSSLYAQQGCAVHL
jgi:hypothetical protein